jgi:hypothetical protein
MSKPCVKSGAPISVSTIALEKTPTPTASARVRRQPSLLRARSIAAMTARPWRTPDNPQ